MNCRTFSKNPRTRGKSHHHHYKASITNEERAEKFYELYTAIIGRGRQFEKDHQGKNKHTVVVAGWWRHGAWYRDVAGLTSGSQLDLRRGGHSSWLTPKVGSAISRCLACCSVNRNKTAVTFLCNLCTWRHWWYRLFRVKGTSCEDAIWPENIKKCANAAVAFWLVYYFIIYLPQGVLGL